MADAPAPEGFGARVRSALAWRYGGQIAAQLITWTSTILVVRLLDPRDYGLFAMSQVVIVALNCLNGWSFATSLIQAKQIGSREIGQVFAMMILLNGTLAALQWLLAPLAADYYGEPLVADMLRVQALLFLTTPFIALPSALLSRRIEFRSQAVANMMGAVTGAVTALGLAWYGFGVWALVYAPILTFAMRALVMTIAAKGIARPVFNFRGAGALFTFGGALTLCQIFWIIQSQSDIFIAGRSFTTHDLGLYAEALFLTLIVTGRFLPPVNEVAFPAYAELHQAGRSLAPYFERTLRSVALVTWPVYIGLAVTAPEAVLTLFGEKWVEMAPIAAGLSLAMPLMAIQIVCSPTTNAMGHPRFYLMSNIAGAVIFVTCFLIGVEYGPMGLVHAWWVGAPLLLGFTLALTMPRVGLSFSRLLAALLPAGAGCAVMAASVFALEALLPSGWPAPLRLALLVPAGAGTYVATLLLAWPALVRDSWDMLRPAPPPLPGPAYPPREEGSP